MPSEAPQADIKLENERAVLEPPTEFLYVFHILPMDFRFNKLNLHSGFNHHSFIFLF